MADLSNRHWFLPDTPDVLGGLREQLAVTIEGVDRLAGWAAGKPCTVSDLREIEVRGEAAKRELLTQLRDAFVTPLEPEDLFTLSRGIGRILTGSADLVGEAEVLESGPDQGIADMTKPLTRALREIDAAVAALGTSPDDAMAAADRAIAVVRDLQSRYYLGMAGLLELDQRGERIARRELYRRCSRIGETAVGVAERVIYAVVKES